MPITYCGCCPMGDAQGFRTLRTLFMTFMWWQIDLASGPRKIFRKRGQTRIGAGNEVLHLSGEGHDIQTLTCQWELVKLTPMLCLLDMVVEVIDVLGTAKVSVRPVKEPPRLQKPWNKRARGNTQKTQKGERLLQLPLMSSSCQVSHISDNVIKGTLNWSKGVPRPSCDFEH